MAVAEEQRWKGKEIKHLMFPFFVSTSLHHQGFLTEVRNQQLCVPFQLGSKSEKGFSANEKNLIQLQRTIENSRKKGALFGETKEAVVYWKTITRNAWFSE